MISRDIVLLKKYGITVKFVTSDDPSEFAAAIDEKTKAVYVETMGNPKYNVSPISEIAKVCDPVFMRTRTYIEVLCRLHTHTKFR